MFKFIIEKESGEAYTVYWKLIIINHDFRDPDDGKRSKAFLTENEARNFIETLKHDSNVDADIRCEYRKIIDLTKPAVAYRCPGPQNTTVKP